MSSVNSSADFGRTRIWVGNPSIVSGAGVLIAPRKIVTCWHVIHPMELGTTDLRVDFPDAVSTSTLCATMETGVPIDANEGGDLALLQLSQPAPVKPARLSRRRRGAEVRVFGYPGRLSTGVWARAIVTGAVDEQTGWYQLDRKEGSVPIEQGFSGAAVFDESHAVVGVVTAVARWSDHAVAWMIPVERWEKSFALSFVNDDDPPRPDPRVLTFAQKHALSTALADIPAMADPETRRRVVFSLSSEVRGAVPSFSVSGVDLFGIVDAVTQFPGGFGELYGIVAALSGVTSSAVLRVHDLANSYGLLEDEA